MKVVNNLNFNILRNLNIGARLEIIHLSKPYLSYQSLKMYVERKAKIQPDIPSCNIIELCQSLMFSPEFNRLLNHDCIGKIALMDFDIIIIKKERSFLV